MLEYHQYQYASAHQGDKDSRRGPRNKQDNAREQSYAMKDQLKGHWRRLRGLHAVAEGASLPVPDGTRAALEETNPDVETAEQPCQPTPAASSRQSSGRSLARGSTFPTAVARSERPRCRPCPLAKGYWEWDAGSGRWA